MISEYQNSVYMRGAVWNRIKQLVGFPAFVGLFLIVFSACVVDNLSGFVAMLGKSVLLE